MQKPVYQCINCYDYLDNCTENKDNFEMNGINKVVNSRANNGIYHEKQVKELCALHALNNLFQEQDAFSKSELDDICHSLSPDVCINPHRSLLGLGNYDVNVIMSALQRKGYEAVWFDKRNDYRLGFVLLPLRRRHWIAIRQVEGSYYNLDSKLDAPHLIGKDEDLMSYLREQLDSKEKELLIIVTKEVEQSQLWQKDIDSINR